MKKIILSIVGLLLVVGLSSCGTDDSKKLEESNVQLNQENLTFKDENTQLKQELESIKKQSVTNSVQDNTGAIAEKDTTKTGAEAPLVDLKPTPEDIKLAGCENTKKSGNIEWCMNNSQLVKSVEGYDTRFSKSIQNDSGFKGIYETDNEDKLYTFEYLEKACGIIEGEGLSIDNTVKETCPCPIGYHVPTPKEWKDTYSFFKGNVNLFKKELGFDKLAWIRTQEGYISKYIDSKNSTNANTYHTNALGSVTDYSQATWVGDKEVSVVDSGYNKGNAFPLRCVKNN